MAAAAQQEYEKEQARLAAEAKKAEQAAEAARLKAIADADAEARRKAQEAAEAAERRLARQMANIDSLSQEEQDALRAKERTQKIDMAMQEQERNYYDTVNEQTELFW